MFAPHVPRTSITFVSHASLTSTVPSYNLQKRIEAVRNCRRISKHDMKFNAVTPKMRVDPERYTVEADGENLTVEPADKVALGQAFYVY